MTAPFANITIAALLYLWIVGNPVTRTLAAETPKTCRLTSQRLDTYIIQADNVNINREVDGGDDEDNDQIVGGLTAKKGAFPFQAAILKDGLQFCGGSLIDKLHILTAAHCLDVFETADVSSLTVYLNTISLKPDPGAIVRGVERVIFPKYYSSESHEFDIALLTLNATVTEIRPVALPVSNVTQTYENEVAKVIGWGTTSYGGNPSTKLMEVEVGIVSNKECGEKYGEPTSDLFLCAASPGKDSCQGDSGGPILLRGTQIGIVSWGYGCANPDYPGVYTRVSKLLTWIKAITAVC